MVTRSSVGIRELRNAASAVIRRVRRGEVVTVTDRRRPVAVIVPYHPSSVAGTLRELVKVGRVSWGGGKPSGSRRPPPGRGRSVADAVIEDRR